MALLAALVAVDYAAFLRGWWLNFSVPALTLTSNVSARLLVSFAVRGKRKAPRPFCFRPILSPEVIRRLLVNPQLVEPKKTEITVMFSDIRGFTTISEKLDAQTWPFSQPIPLGHDRPRLRAPRHSRQIHRRRRDGFLGWRPSKNPATAARACHTALKMMERVREMQKKWESEGKPHLDIGIGLNTGVASVGNMGSALRYGLHRFSATP